MERRAVGEPALRHSRDHWPGILPVMGHECVSATGPSAGVESLDSPPGAQVRHLEPDFEPPGSPKRARERGSRRSSMLQPPGCRRRRGQAAPPAATGCGHGRRRWPRPGDRSRRALLKSPLRGMRVRSSRADDGQRGGEALGALLTRTREARTDPPTGFYIRHEEVVRSQRGKRPLSLLHARPRRLQARQRHVRPPVR